MQDRSYPLSTALPLLGLLLLVSRLPLNGIPHGKLLLGLGL
jgi:hypothetical protein